MLVYGHYDVQPAEPLDLWTTPPFEPTMRNGRIYARGSVDDKGQLFAHMKALEAHLGTRGKLPVNIVVLAEGEEEVGSDNLEAFVTAQAKRLACDYVVISDSSMFAPGLPSILSSLRGLAYFQIDLEGPTSDLHSGSYGGAVVNPAMALARILATFFDEKGRIAIPGFYDSVREWSPKLRGAIAALPFDESNFRKEVGAPALGGEAGYSTLERLWSRPTCEVNGMLSGYTAEGSKTVLPSKAMAKVSCRLVADQSPAEIEKLVREHIASVTPPGVKVTRADAPRRTAMERGARRPALRRREARAERRLRARSGDHRRRRLDPRRQRPASASSALPYCSWDLGSPAKTRTHPTNGCSTKISRKGSARWRRSGTRSLLVPLRAEPRI